MFPWPHLELTDYERKYVGYYASDTKPGVLKRIYQVRLSSLAVATAQPPILAPLFQGSVQISRRSRVFGLTFSGDTYAWRLTISTASGETFTGVEPQTGLPPLVSSMWPGTVYNVNAVVGEPAALGSALTVSCLQIDPNWVLMPNQTLIFAGQLAEALDPAEDQRFLSIGVHVWEFPGMV